MTSTRANQRPWITAFANPPPPTCTTLRDQSNTVEYGLQCVFTEEDNDPVPFSVNVACLPWGNLGLPSSSVFYSPATACPSSWTAVATRTAAEGATDWIDGETALECCPPGFVGGSGGMCNPGSGTFDILKCGEADADENENATFTAGQWPAGVSAKVTALNLRYQASDTGGAARETGSRTSSTVSSTSSALGGGSSGGLSTGAKAAVGAVIPLLFILGALAVFLLWRRRKHRKAVAAFSKDRADGQETKQSYDESLVNRNSGLTSAPNGAAVAATTAGVTHETPEWNAELDAIEAERRRYMAVQGSLFPPDSQAHASSPGGASEVSELGGTMRVNRKPIAPIELDSTPALKKLAGSGNPEKG